MKNKIKNFSKGDFHISKPAIVFPKTHLVLKIGEGEVYSGQFTIENNSDGDIRGLVYPSSFRMRCKKQGFQGNPVTIEFEYDGRGLQPGFVEQGMFTVVCNGGEYTVSFSAIINKPFVETSQGKIQDLRGFKKIAYNNFEEAKQIFRSRDFYELIKYEEPKVKYLYDNMRKWRLDGRGMEEFLVAIKQKEKIFISMEVNERNYENIDQSFQDHLRLTKNTWGYMEWEVQVRGEFLNVPSNIITTNEFRGMNYELAYTVEKLDLHAGRNFGQIILTNGCDEEVFDIEITNAIPSNEKKNIQNQVNYAMAFLLKKYIKCEKKGVFDNDWVLEGTKIINELESYQPNDIQNKLYQAHIYLLADQKSEAKWILDTYNYSKFSVGRNIEQDAYFLYLSALQKDDYIYTKKVVEELQRLYLKYATSWKILCMLIQLDPYYKDYYERKHALEHQFNLGGNHLILYMESLKCFRERCSNLKKLGEFEIQILLFGIKYGLLEKELALYTANLATQQKQFDKRILEILEGAYKLHDDVMILNAICTILIKGNLASVEYFKWFDLAVREELKIAMLYEYYMTSIDVEKVEGPLPRTVHLYFAHGNNLTNEKAALLYANLVQYEKESSELYAYYKEFIKVFTLEQLEARKINKHLRILYRKFLDTNELNIEKIKAMYDIVFSYMITTDTKNIQYVLVVEQDGVVRQRVPYTEKGAVVVLDSKDSTVVWETKAGAYYVGTVKYDTERLFYELPFVELCKKHADIFATKEIESKKKVVNIENLQTYGLHCFEENEVLDFCSKNIIQDDYEEDEFLLYLSHYLYQKEFYDRNTLIYLTMYYCGATREMKELWYAAQDYEIETQNLAERIITQMIFTESMFGGEEIFIDYYTHGAYFRLEEAYIACIANEYVVKNREVMEETMLIMLEELDRKPKLPDVIHIAVLKYFSCHPYPESGEKTLKKSMEQLCERQIVFPFYYKYKKEWLREVQLGDKTMVSYRALFNGKVKLVYQMFKGGKMIGEPVSEMLPPMYENIYVKKFLVFDDEEVRYHFVEIKGDRELKSKECAYKLDKKASYYGKYGRLNDMIRDVDGRDEKIKEYALEVAYANKIFIPYE